MRAAIAALAGALALAAPPARKPALPQPPPGWRIDVVAEAPRVRHPSIVTVAPDGRVFVAEDPMDISAPADAQLGRILVFHPDGHVSVFADELHAVFGLLYLDGKLVVHHAPRLTVFRDGGDVGRDPVDLVACTNPKPWALDWNDHVPANLRLAMDGYLYMSVGDKGIKGAVGRDGSTAELHGGGVLRLRPDGTALEVYATGTRNHLDVAINAEDELFTYDNSDERNGWWTRVTHMVDGGYYGYPWDYRPRRPYTLWMMADYGGGAPTAALAYEEDALPDEYRGDLFMADFGKRQILRLHVARDGATYRIASRQDFGADPPADYRPVGLALGADGRSFYVGDWQHRDVKANVVVGRLLKLTWTGPSQARPRPAWFLAAATGRPFGATTADLVAALRHPARSVRLVAQRRLAERGGAAVAPLVALLADRGAPAYARWHAIWALDAADGGAAGRAAILAAADDADPSVRRQALRQLGTRRAPAAAAIAVARLRDADASVRFQAATALGRIGAPGSVAPLLGALDETDLFARFAAFTALNRIGRARPDAWRAIAAGLRAPARAVREGALFAMRETYAPEVVAALADPALPPDTRAEALAVLAALARQTPPWQGEWWAYFPLSSPPPARTVAWAGTDAALAALRGGLTDRAPGVRRAAIDGLAAVGDIGAAPRLAALFRRERDLEVRRATLRALAALRAPEAAPLARAVLADGRSTLQGEAVALAEALKDTGALVRFATAPGRDPAAVRVAVGALGAAGDARAAPALERVAAHAPDPSVQVAAIAALAQLAPPGAARAIEPLLAASDVELRRAAAAALGTLQDRDAVPALIAAFGAPETRNEAAAALARMPDARALDAYLFGLASPSPPLRDACRRAVAKLAAELLPAIQTRLGQAPPSPVLVAQLQEIYRPLAGRLDTAALLGALSAQLDAEAYLAYALAHGGDPARGRRLFEDERGVACARCHRVAGRGGAIGPDLSTIGAQFARRELAENVLYPSRAMREGYEQVIVTVRSGDPLAGLVRGETSDEIVLEDAGGARHRVRKADVLRREQSRVSIMPEGLQAGLSLQEFADLIAYLESLR